MEIETLKIIGSTFVFGLSASIFIWRVGSRIGDKMDAKLIVHREEAAANLIAQREHTEKWVASLSGRIDGVVKDK